LKKNYNVKELQEKNKEIIAKNQAEMNQTVEKHIPAKTLNQAGAEEQKGEAEEEQ
jgi:hypothetical protein